VQTGKLLKESDKESGHKKTVTALTKSVDGSHFLTGSLDKSAKVLISQSIYSILFVLFFIYILKPSS
jgi:translation initiation factor 3 subunit I